MADRHWIGGTGTWDQVTTTHWSATAGGAGGASVPTASDDVYFDASSGAGVVTVSANAPTNSIDCSGFTGTLAQGATTLTMAGGNAGTGYAFRLVAGMTYTQSSGSLLSFTATTNNGGAGWSVDTGGQTTAPTTFNGAGGSWTFQADYTWTTGGTGAMTLTAGTLNTNGKALSGWLFNSSGSTARTLTLGATVMTLSASSTSAFTISTSTNLTITSNTAVIVCTGATATFTGSTSKNLNGMSIVMSGSGTCVITMSLATCANIVRVGTAAKTDALQFSNSMTITGTLVFQGNNASTFRLLASSSAVGTARTLTVNGSTTAAVTLGGTTYQTKNVDIQDISGAGSASWDLSAITGNSGDAQGNIGITFTPGITASFTGTAGGNWSALPWSVRVPLPQDDVTIANAFAATQTITFDLPRLGRTIDFTGATGSPTLFVASGTSYGGLTVITGMSLSGTGTWTFSGRGSYAITSAGKQFLGAITITAPTGTYTFADAYNLASTRTLTITTGTVIFGAGGTSGLYSLTSSANVNVDFGAFVHTASGTGTIFSFGANSIVTADAATLVSSSTSATTRTLGLSTKTIGTVSATSSSTATHAFTGSPIIGTLNISGAARSVSFVAGNTYTITNWNVFGTAGNLISLISATPGTQYHLSKSGGLANSDYLNITDSDATGGALWFAGNHSTLVSNDTGWILSQGVDASASAVAGILSIPSVLISVSGISYETIQIGTLRLPLYSELVEHLEPNLARNEVLDGTLYVRYFNNARKWTIKWGTLSVADYDQIRSLYQQQFAEQRFLPLQINGLSGSLYAQVYLTIADKSIKYSGQYVEDFELHLEEQLALS